MDPICGRLKGLFYRRLESELARVTDRIIVLSPEERDFALRLGISAQKLSLVPNGIEPESLPTRDQVRCELGLDADRLTVGFVGRFTPQKNPELLIDAFARVADQFPEARLVMVGDGPLAPRVRSLVAARGLADRVLLPGGLDGRRVMPAFDLLVLTSRYEGFPYVSLEGLLAGLPLLATDTSSPKLIIADGFNGFIAPADASELAERLGRLLRDRALRDRMGRRAALKAAEFGTDRMVDGLLAIYQELFPQGHAGRAAVRGWHGRNGFRSVVRS